ncbi:kinase-like domain-containing protein [Mycena vitilis]|nr:kinase-like domain-containing protein [Mycena vitilis]
MDVLIDRPAPAGLKLSRFMKLTLPKLIRSYGELIVISEEVEVAGDLLCLMQNALLLVRLSVHTSTEYGSELVIEDDYPHLLLKVLLPRVTGVRWSAPRHLCIATEHGTHKLGTVPDNVYYRNWQPAVRFVTARRLAFAIRLRISASWTEEDDLEADFFAGDVPATDRVMGNPDLRLAAIYGSILRVGDVRTHIARHTIWGAKYPLEARFLVLRESAILLYKARAISKQSGQDQCISLRAIKGVTSLPQSDTSIQILTGTKSWTLSLESIRAGSAPARTSALERVNHLTTQITIPRDPYASGAFANVYKEDWQRRTVAVKVFLDRKSEGPVFERRLRREVNVWCRLDHPNIVPLLGITYDFGASLSMVSPWLKGGTLHTYLKSTTTLLGNRRRLLMDIARGLAYLHSKSVVHGDLHPANILMTDDGSPQLSDFGLSTIVPEFEGTSYMTTSCIAGAVRWAAPEMLRTHPDGDNSLNVSTMSDVYSFGGIIYQVLCGDIPFVEIENNFQVLFAVVLDNRRPSRSRVISSDDWQFICQCWDGDPIHRPAVPDIQEFLRQG